MKKRAIRKVISIILIVVICLSFAFPALATNVAVDENGLKKGELLVGERTISYKYKEENGEVVYAEVGNEIIEKVGEEIRVNGEVVATVTTTVLYQSEQAEIDTSMNAVLPSEPALPQSGWTWSTQGDDNDFFVTPYEIKKREINLQAELWSITLDGLAVIIEFFLPAPAIVRGIAAAILRAISDELEEYADITVLYSIETTYQHKYLGLSYAKKMNYRYSCNQQFTAEPAGSNTTVYCYWA